MALELRNIVKTVGVDTHIHQTNLTLSENGFNILLGTTLAGKTTLMHLMAGLDQPSNGEIWFNDENVTGVPVQKRNVSMVYQQFINYPNFTVFENIASPLRVARMAASEIKERVGRVAELLRLSPMLDRRPSELSGGQQQRTALARALVKDADLVLLDEPLANLDFKLREELRDELPKLFADRRCTVVYATTEPSEALLLGGHTATMHEGRVTEYGPTGTVYRSPGDMLTARVFSEPPINLAAVTKSGKKMSLSDGVAWTATGAAAKLPDGPYTVGIRAHNLAPVKQGKQSVKLDGSVQITELSGSESVVHFAHGGVNWISLATGIHPFNVGDVADFYLDPGACLYFDPSNRLVAN